MSSIHVGIGEYRVSGNPSDIIKTFALGSCVGVVVYDPSTSIAGLMHVALPDSTVNAERAAQSPGYFVDTGLPLFLNALRNRGVSGERAWIKIVGGSNIMDENRRFDIGKRNVLAIKKCLWRKNLGIIAQDIGGDISRTVTVEVARGSVRVTSAGRHWEL